MQKIINLSEAEVLNTFKVQPSYYVLEGKVVFKKVSCLIDYVLTFENNKKIFEKGKTYALWIAQVQNKSTGVMFYFVALPKLNDDGENNFYIVPQEVFGFVELKIEPTYCVIERVPYQLVVSPTGKQMLVPTWHLDRTAVESHVARMDKSVPLKYQLIPRFLGKNLNNMFPAWEVKKIFEERYESFYFNVFTGEIKSDWQKQNVFISIGCNQKNMQLGNLSIAYRNKRIVLKF